MTALEKAMKEHGHSKDFIADLVVEIAKDCGLEVTYRKEKLTEDDIIKPADVKCDIPNEPRILDSGNRTEFESGAVRDMREGKGRCDLLPLDVVAEYLGHDEILHEIHLFKYSGDVNYLYRCLSHFEWHWGRNVERAEDLLLSTVSTNYKQATMLLETSIHFEEGAKKYGDNNWQKGIPVRYYIDSAVRHYLKFLRGDKDEPHDRAFCWNFMCAIWTCKHKPELNDYRKEEV